MLYVLMDVNTLFYLANGVNSASKLQLQRISRKPIIQWLEEVLRFNAGNRSYTNKRDVLQSE